MRELYSFVYSFVHMCKSICYGCAKVHSIKLKECYNVQDMPNEAKWSLKHNIHFCEYIIFLFVLQTDPQTCVCVSFVPISVWQFCYNRTAVVSSSHCYPPHKPSSSYILGDLLDWKHASLKLRSVWSDLSVSDKKTGSMKGIQKRPLETSMSAPSCCCYLVRHLIATLQN